MPVINEYTLKQWKAKFPTIIWRCDDAFLGHVIGFADALGKRKEFEQKIEQMAFPTFFGKPAHTVVSPDSPVSFYFTIFLDEDTYMEFPGTAHERLTIKHGAHFAMNGGMIFHPAYKKDESGKEVVDYANGSWSIHT
jgi:hypothetical protein